MVTEGVVETAVAVGAVAVEAAAGGEGVGEGEAAAAMAAPEGAMEEEVATAARAEGVVRAAG